MLRPSGLQPETPIPIVSVVEGDHIFLFVKQKLVISPHVLKGGKIQWRVKNQAVTKRGYDAVNVEGTIAKNDTTNHELTINVGITPNFQGVGQKAIAVIPWDTISHATIERIRIEGTPPHETINQRFPRKIPVSF